MKKYNLITILFLIYLAVMAYFGLDNLRNGGITLSTYMLILAVSLATILLLRSNMKRRSRKREMKKKDDEINKR